MTLLKGVHSLCDRFYFFLGFLRAHPSSLKSGSLSLKNSCQSSFFFGPRASEYPRSARLGLSFFVDFESFSLDFLCFIALDYEMYEFILFIVSGVNFCELWK